MASPYSGLAADYHLLFPARQERLLLLRSLAGPAPARVLELGSGTGEYVAALANHGYQATGIELDPAMHAAALQRHPEQAAKLIHADLLEAADCVRGPFALVFCAGNAIFSLASVEDIAQALSQMLDLAYPGGKVLLAFPNFDHLASEARRAIGLAKQMYGPGSQGTEPLYVSLPDEPPRAGSPQMASISNDEVRLYLPPLSASRNDGTRIEMERSYSASRDGWQSPDAVVRASLLLSLQSTGQRGQSSLDLLGLGRKALEQALCQAIALSTRQVTQRLTGGWDSRDWSPEAPLTAMLLGVE